MNEEVEANVDSKQINISRLAAGVYNVVLIQNGNSKTAALIKK